MAKSNPPSWQRHFSRVSPPSWAEFVALLGSGFTGYEGLAASLQNKCSPCYYHYNAVIYMETFQQDSNALLNNVGLDWASLHHRNVHGNHNIERVNIERVFTKSNASVIEGIIN